MGELMTYLAGFGLAAGAGAKAFVPALLLGALHHTPWYDLSDRWLWLADPVVMSVLGVLVVAEILVDSVPELAEYADVVAYLPKFVVGFLGFAAVTGTLDEDLVALGGSGLLGGGTAATVHWVRTKVRRPFRDTVETLHAGFGRAASLGEAGMSAGLTASAVLLPPLSVALVAGLAVAAFVTGRVGGGRASCGACGGSVHRDALACPHCGADLG